MASENFSAEAMAHSHHVYKDVWEAAVGKELHCKRKPGNRQDPFAVAVVRSAITVGHVLKKILSVCSMFLRRGGAIKCEVTTSKRYLEDLPQEGLEITYTITFKGPANDLAKAKKLVKYALTPSPADKKNELAATNKMSQLLPTRMSQLQPTRASYYQQG